MSALPSRHGSPLGRPIVDAAFLADPYPTYRALREAGRIHWSDEFFDGAWLLTHHADVDAVLRDPRFSAQRTGGWVMQDDAARRQLGGLQRLFARALLFLDAPDHLRIRRVLAGAFTPAALQRLVPHVERTLAALLADVDAESGFDFMASVARPLPARVVATMMGIDEAERERFVAWSDDLADFIGAPQPTLAQAQRTQTSVLAMADFFAGLLPRRRRSPGDDLVSRLVQAEAAGEIASSAELLAQCAMLLFAGHETTRNMLGNGLAALLAERAQWDRLLAEPNLMASAVRELIRFDSAVQYTGRRVAADMVLHGQPLRRGDLVIALIGAANRDPVQYADPDVLDIARRQGPPLSFGAGAHVCIGAALAQIEAEVVLRELARRWPRLVRCAERVTWNGNAVYRGPSTLLVRDAA